MRPGDTAVRRLLGVAAAVAATGILPVAGAQAATSSPIHHVFVIVLENESASTTFGSNSPAPYLSSTLRSQGAFLPNYYGIGHNSLDNYIAMISGQAPNPQTQADCQIFNDFVPGTVGVNGQAVGTGCVYPTSVHTLPDQLEAAGLSWRGYEEDMGADPLREPSVCAHPAIGAPDNTQKATAVDQYATRHNPFVYFHSIIDDQTRCDSHVVNLDRLPQDLASTARTPNYTIISPDLCNDGHDAPCANGDPGGLAQADGFLRKWVPMITGSPAFRAQGGLLIVTFDEATTSDTGSCCGEIPGPNSPSPGITGPGGGRVGAVLLSPCISPGTVSQQPYNHYTMLRSVEDAFGLTHLGYASLPGGQAFGSDVFNRRCTPAPSARIHAPALASKASSKPRVTVSWSGSDGDGAGIASFTVQVRGAGKDGWRTLRKTTTRRSLRFAGKPGSTYRFRVSATDQAGLVSRFATATTVMPSGVRVAGARYRGPWHTVRVRRAWQGRAITCGSPRCSLTLQYRGGAVAVIGERGPRGGSARVTLDGHVHTISLHSSRARTRRVIYRARVREGRHRLTIRVLRGAVALEGYAITR